MADEVKKAKPKLFDGVVHHADGRNQVIVDPDIVFPAWLKLFKADAQAAAKAKAQAKAKDGEQAEEVETPEINIPVTQYWIECAYQCTKMDIQIAMGGFGFSIKILNRPKYRLADLPDPAGQTPEGVKYEADTGIHRATKGKEAREHFKRIRGFLPA